ncbi:MAG: histone deacetylase family protein [Gammaproteobacteria bacterium]|nr:histone deacetylase family protein [Gammaproteobacteria bacterium]
MTTALNIFYADACLDHDMGPGHVELPQRVEVIRKYLQSSALSQDITWLTPELASQQQLYLAHTRDYIDAIFANAPSEGMLYLDPDTSMSPGSLMAAQSASGAAIASIDLVTVEPGPTFCLTRPPGHHAEAHQAMGFCIFNHIALAACYAQQKGFKRIAIADFDVHHGNGTEQILSNKSGMLFLSSFQSPFYPFSGTGNTANHIVNSPYTAGLSSQAFRELIETKWQTVLSEFEPDLLLISAGFDAHKEDAISQANLTEEDYFWVSKKLQLWTHDSTKGRVVSILEGGYNLDVLGPCVEAHLQGLLD